MKTTKTLIALAVSLAAFGANAQVDQAAKDARQAAQHRVDQQRAENKAAESGAVGKAVNNTKAEYHKNMAEHNANEVKEEELGVKKDKGVVIRRDSSVTPAVPSASSTAEGGPGLNNGTPPATTPKR